MSKRSQLCCRAEDVRTRAGGDLSTDRWSEGTPPGIETAHGGNRDRRQGKQNQEVSGEVWKIGVQGEEETRNQLARGERRGRDDQLGGQENET